MNTPLKNARKEKGYTLSKVAQLVGSDTGNISRIENGKQVPSRILMQKLVGIFAERGITEIHLLYPERYADDSENI
ncbi:helix-turn-helix transcriptional regulator [Paralysiella testudinis]|uniref:Helix-turn-helix transcriptional regulator n=2 Tax=Paralysiella testudinis TaxID=2809020 RepID=A0A892ZKY9_9NEIS|nr:helix-turn-helix transcriptional regulator [Paralysiella testudinis]